MKSKSLQLLDRLAWEAKKEKFPDTPEYILTSKKYKDNTANNLTRAVIDFINFMGYQAERISVTGRRVDDRKTYTDVLGHTKQVGSVKFVKSSMRKGSADISATLEGRAVKVEIKKKDSQSDDQKQYQAEVEQAGGIYIIVRSFDQFLDWYMRQNWIKNKPKI